MRTHSPVRTALLALGAGLALLLTRCGGATTATSTTATPAPATASPTVDAAHDDADLAFVTGMHPHHQGAVTMSELASTRAQDQRVKDLAARVAQAQGPEMAQLESMAQAWGAELVAGHHHEGMDMGGDSAALEGLAGAAFDRAFLRSMSTHHEGALPMARAELSDGSNPQAQQMARQIVDVQQAEIAEMERLLTQL